MIVCEQALSEPSASRRALHATLALAAVATAVMLVAIGVFDDGFAPNDKEPGAREETEITSQTIVNPRYATRLQDGSVVLVRASRALPQKATPTRIKLDDIRVRMEDPKGNILYQGVARFGMVDTEAGHVRSFG